MPSDDSSVRDALNHQSLKVSRDDPGPRPMIAVLDARPGLAGQLREKIAELAAQVRREPGCLTFTAYEARDVPGRFYLYEVYGHAETGDVLVVDNGGRSDEACVGGGLDKLRGHSISHRAPDQADRAGPGPPDPGRSGTAPADFFR
jgi:hypothetical protein